MLPLFFNNSYLELTLFRKDVYYSSDLTDSQWNHIKEFFEKEQGPGRPQQLEMREIVNFEVSDFHSTINVMRWCV
jgi:hypothetical protein